MASSSAPIVPNEILVDILQRLKPERREYNISTSDDDIDFDPATLKSLLRTSTLIHDEVLHHTERHCLNIHITSGSCPCKSLKRVEMDSNDKGAFQAIQETSFGKLLHLPLWALDKVVVKFMPVVHDSADEACSIKRDNTYRSLLSPRDVVKLQHSMQCVVRQSVALASFLERYSAALERIRFHFVFEGPKPPGDWDMTNCKYLWDLQLVRRALRAWRWISTPEKSMPPIDYPAVFYVGVDKLKDGGFDPTMPLLPQQNKIRRRVVEEMEWWWMGKQPEGGRFIWNHDDVNRAYEAAYMSNSPQGVGPLQVLPCVISNLKSGNGDGSGEDCSPLFEPRWLFFRSGRWKTMGPRQHACI